jgi:hypothetical protein
MLVLYALNDYMEAVIATWEEVETIIARQINIDKWQ